MRPRARKEQRRRLATFAAVLISFGCSAGVGRQVYTMRGWTPGVESSAIEAATEKTLGEEGTVLGTDKEKGEIYAEVKGFAVSVRVDPTTAWMTVTCRSDGAWVQGAASSTWEVKPPAKIELSQGGLTPESCAEDLLDKIRRKL